MCRFVPSITLSRIRILGEHKNGFDWFKAFDYYTCRRGHGINFSVGVCIVGYVSGYQFVEMNVL